jgi:hypothetical protein
MAFNFILKIVGHVKIKNDCDHLLIFIAFL